MIFSLFKRFTARIIVVVSFCLLLSNCGNKSALFLDSSEPEENKELNVDKISEAHSEEEANAKGENPP